MQEANNCQSYEAQALLLEIGRAYEILDILAQKWSISKNARYSENCGVYILKHLLPFNTNLGVSWKWFKKISEMRSVKRNAICENFEKI